MIVNMCGIDQRQSSSRAKSQFLQRPIGDEDDSEEELEEDEAAMGSTSDRCDCGVIFERVCVCVLCSCCIVAFFPFLASFRICARAQTIAPLETRVSASGSHRPDNHIFLGLVR